MKLYKAQLMVDILFILSTRSSKYWKAKEMLQHLTQLGHDKPTSAKIRHVLTDMVNLGYLETVKVKPQWSMYAYKLTGKATHLTVPVQGGPPVDRRENAEMW